MDLVLKRLLNKFALIYLDYIIIAWNSVEKHVEHLYHVFTLLRQAGLTVKLKKCTFGRKEIKYFGFKSTKECVKFDGSKNHTIPHY